MLRPNRSVYAFPSLPTRLARARQCVSSGIRLLSLVLILVGGLAPARGQIIADTTLPEGNVWRLNVTGTPRNGEDIHLGVTTTPGSTVLFAFGTRSASETYPFGVLLIDPMTIFASVVVGVEPNGLASFDLPLRRLRNDARFVTQAAILDPSGTLTLTNSFRIVIQGGIEGTWTDAAALPQSRGALAAVTYRNRIHMFGGSTTYGQEGFRSPAHYIYYPDLNVWNRHGSLPDTSTWGVRTALVNEKIYALGGWPGGGKLNRVYDLRTAQWSYLAGIPAVFEWGHTVSAVGEQVYIIGPAGVWAYDVRAYAWTSKRPAPLTSRSLASATMDGKIYLVGDGTELAIYDPVSDTWAAGPALPFAANAPSVAVNAGKLYVFGGSTSGLAAAHGHVQVFDPRTEAWWSLPDMPTRRSWSAAASFGNRIFVLGGFDTAGRAIDAMEVVR